MRSDSRWLRRARARFANRFRAWAEKASDPVAYRERVYAIGDAMVRHGLLASGVGATAAHSVLGCWARRDGVKWWYFVRSDLRREVAAKMQQDFQRWLSMQSRTG